MYLDLDRAGRTGLRTAMKEALHVATDPLTSDAAIRRGVIDLTMSMVTPGFTDIAQDTLDLATAIDVEIRVTKGRTGMTYVSLDLDVLGRMHGPEVARIAAGLVGLFPRPRRGVAVWSDAPVQHRGPLAPVEIATLADVLAGG